jgi:putative DNA methylase
MRLHILRNHPSAAMTNHQAKQQALPFSTSSHDSDSLPRGIECQFDVPFVAGMALREKQIQQNYRPVIAIHKWFARRPGTLFRALLLSEFVPGPLRESYFRSHDLRGIKVADPFMGGGTPLIEANRIGCDVIGHDINAMAYWIVRQAIENLDLQAYQEAASGIACMLEQKVGSLYRTRCLECFSLDAHVKYFLWVKISRCLKCGRDFDLLPGFLLAENRRHPMNVIVCSQCGELNEARDRKRVGKCSRCEAPLTLQGPASRNRCACPHCGEQNVYPVGSNGAPRHRMFAIEYYCSNCKPRHYGRFFKKPDPSDLKNMDQAVEEWARIHAKYVPDDKIPGGDETNRLLRWGYRLYREMFNERQLLGLELICRSIGKEADRRIRGALATNLSDLLRYQNMLCRYDTSALKSLDVFSVHGFPVGLIECESNIIGIPNGRDSANIGSGGWSNIVDKYLKAKRYCESPFEVSYESGSKREIPIADEWIGDHQAKRQPRRVSLACKNSTEARFPRASLDGVFTDPPYYSNVQYAELMDFCYVWLRRLIGADDAAFGKSTTRDAAELTGNVSMDRGLTHFTEGLSTVFCKMSQALKPGSPLAFTYHHNSADAYFPLIVALLDARLVCSASLPCPAEMGASIHINRTGSSVVDTVFVCRSTGRVPRRILASKANELAELVREDLVNLRAGGLTPTQGDTRCLALGHLARMAVWKLRVDWNATLETDEKLRIVDHTIQDLGGLSAVEEALGEDRRALTKRRLVVAEAGPSYGAQSDEVSF